jgi:subtilase family serine protease
MIPAIGAHPVFLEAGRAGEGTFPCESVTASVRCYTPAQLVQTYGWSAYKNRGKGQTIVVVDAFQSPTLLQDLDLEDSTFGLPPADLTVIAPQGLTPWDVDNQDMMSWSGEISLDVESIHAYAPGARIILDLAKSDSPADLLAATKYAVDDDLGSVISMSFGAWEECIPTKLLDEQHGVFVKAVREGISLIASSGDLGAAQVSCSGDSYVLGVSSPASDPDVTSVGGTNVFLASGGGWTGEVAWDDGYGESGGGISTIYPAPSYQQALGAPARLVPDVAYNAGVDGGIIIAWGSSGEGAGLFFDLGGTSAGAPAWAALAALADQEAGHPLGLLNPKLYRLGESKRYASYFHDITIGDNIEGIGGYSTLPGFDLVTGWGTPQIAALIPALAATKSVRS